jgi:hypothetical protein
VNWNPANQANTSIIIQDENTIIPLSILPSTANISLSWMSNIFIWSRDGTTYAPTAVSTICNILNSCQWNDIIDSVKIYK